MVFGELRLVPQQHTVHFRYYSVRDYPDEIYVNETPVDASTKQMLVVIIAIIGAIVMLVAFVVLFCVVSCGKLLTTRRRLISRSYRRKHSLIHKLTAGVPECSRTTC